MPAVTVRNISPEIHVALKQRAALHGRSTEAEIRLILEEAVREPTAADIWEGLQAIGREFGITDEFEIVRDQTTAGFVSFDDRD